LSKIILRWEIFLRFS